MASASSQFGVPVSVHFFDNNPTESVDNFGVLWHLVDIDQPPRQDSKTPKHVEWPGISEGDLVIFPSLLSGAGEFESVRIVGPRDTVSTLKEGEEEIFPLLTAGIEYPEFPTVIVSMASSHEVSLRDLYEAPLGAVLQSQPPHLSLRDVLSQDEDSYEQFWNNPPVARRRRPPEGDPWRISLAECVWVRTVKGESLSKKQKAGTKDGTSEEL